MKTLEVLDRVLAGKRITDGSKHQYRNALGHLTEFTEDWPMDAGLVNKWVAQLPTNWSDETVCKRFEMCVAAGNYIQKIMGRNPDGSFRFYNAFKDAEKPRIKRKQRRYFTADEMVNCLKACSGEMELALISTLIDSTCRIGELVGLRGSDVSDGFFVCQKGKTGQRRYRLDVRICEQLRRLAGGGDKPVFTLADGVSPATTPSLSWLVRKVIRKAGITGKKVGAHTLRHSGASLVAKKTQSALVVKALLQHDKIDTSMIYIHDAETEIQQSISPLAMINVKPVELKTLLITDGSVIEPDEPEDIEVVETVDLIGEMFPEIPKGVSVRPLLKESDLSLIRELAVEYARTYGGSSGIYKVQELLRRMLRKANCPVLSY